MKNQNRLTFSYYLYGLTAKDYLAGRPEKEEPTGE